MRYDKPPKSFEEQLDLLIARGLRVGNRNHALENLELIGYYRLSGYWYPWKRITSKVGKNVVRIDEFMPGHSFESAVAIYSTDRRLRLLLLDALERIEIAIRVQIASIVGRHGPLGYLDQGNLGNHAHRTRGTETRTNFEIFVSRNEQLLDRSREVFADHIKQKYDGVPPIWIAIELWDFGQMSSFYSIMAPKDQTTVANAFGIPKKQIMINWLQALNYLRNLCAHHSRLYRRTLVVKPNPTNMSFFPELAHIRNLPLEQSAMPYSVLCVVVLLMEQISPESKWPNAVRALIDTVSTDESSVSLEHYGFPDDWQSAPIWNQP